MTFAAPALLWGWLALPAAIAAYLLVRRRRMRYAVRFTNVDLLAGVGPRAMGWRRYLPAACYVLALGALLTSLARPQATVAVPREQATVILVMDTSGSMAATDVQPSRLVAARQAARTFIDQLPAPFQVAVVAFSGAAETLALPTTDRPAVREALGLLRAEGGTAMGDGIERAIQLAQTIPPDGAPPATPTPAATATPAPADSGLPAAILLLSDGANTSGLVQPLQAAAHARDLGIPVYTIALGTPTGTLESLGRRQPVPPDPVTLSRIAEITGGEFFTAPTAGDLQRIYRDLGSRIGYVHEQREITVAFVAAGAVLLAAGGALAVAWLNRCP
jgi:Ca-activated chloride channel family protein